MTEQEFATMFTNDKITCFHDFNRALDRYSGAGAAATTDLDYVDDVRCIRPTEGTHDSRDDANINFKNGFGMLLEGFHNDMRDKWGCVKDGLRDDDEDLAQKGGDYDNEIRVAVARRNNDLKKWARIRMYKLWRDGEEALATHQSHPLNRNARTALYATLKNIEDKTHTVWVKFAAF
ncbi:MAG: hypothetical protein D3925_06115, partial [Candidatus Electrothrix sp. AR5]|nr:hypothetical protein [Candidatus Electrothrix sp. AR5]